MSKNLRDTQIILNTLNEQMNLWNESKVSCDTHVYSYKKRNPENVKRMALFSQKQPA